MLSTWFWTTMISWVPKRSQKRSIMSTNCMQSSFTRATQPLVAITIHTSKIRIIPRRIPIVNSNPCGIVTMMRLSNLWVQISLLSRGLLRMLISCFTKSTIYRTCTTIITRMENQVNAKLWREHHRCKLDMAFTVRILVILIRGITTINTKIIIRMSSVKWWRPFTEAELLAFSSKSRREEMLVTIWISLSKSHPLTKPWWRFKTISERAKHNLPNG